MSVSYQISSDLHIENFEDDVDPLKLITPKADVLILAGDIGSLYKYEQLFQFINNLVNHFKFILYIPGNHEYYTLKNEDIQPKTFTELNNILKRLENSFDKLHVLNCKSVIIEDTCIVGTTLWSELKCPLPKYIVRIYGFNGTMYNELHKRDVKYIKHMKDYCKKNKLEMLCVTHHPPSYDFLKKNSRKKFNSLYASDLDYIIDKDINTWVFGHVHVNYDIVKNDCRCVSNQLGKPKDKITDYIKSFVLST